MLSTTRQRRQAMRRRRAGFVIGIVVVVAAIVAASVLIFDGRTPSTSAGGRTSQSTGSSTSGSTASGSTSTSGSSTSVTGSTTSTLGGMSMNVAPVAGTRPSDFKITSKIFRGTTAISTFTRSHPIDFGPGNVYTTLQGIVTFRGNNYREGASYGTADVQTAQLVPIWSVPTSSVAKSGGKGAWTGSGWTGQPLIVKWPDDLKNIMDIKPAKKAEQGLTEVIYPCLDGKIYFLDLKDGTYTRAPIVSGGGPFKGTASIYPDGTPILFVGHGDGSPGKQSARVRLYSLIDQKLLYTFGAKPDPNSHRSWYAYDSSALFNPASDTIVEPGENGILYTIRLNTKFDKAAGTLSVSPGTPIKANYAGPLYKDTGTAVTTKLWGMEDSAVAWKNYLYVADNGGALFCWDLNTMKLVWVQNVLDDTNTSPVFEEENGHGYIYISTSVHETAKTTASGRKGSIPIWKIDAATGEIVWKSQPYSCYTVLDVSGGVQDTPVLGEKDISNLVIYAIARTPDPSSGILVALDKNTGKEVWRTSMKNYAWSSPVAVYTPQGKSYIVQCDSVGNMFLIEGTTGRIVSSINLGANIEASPAVFGNTIVVGTRGQKIFGIEIK